MSFSRAFQWYHSHLDPIWPDGTFKGNHLKFEAVSSSYISQLCFLSNVQWSNVELFLSKEAASAEWRYEKERSTCIQVAFRARTVTLTSPPPTPPPLPPHAIRGWRALCFLPPLPPPTHSPWLKYVIFSVVRIWTEVIGHLWEVFDFSQKKGGNIRGRKLLTGREYFGRSCRYNKPVQYGRDAAHISWAVWEQIPTWGLHGGEATSPEREVGDSAVPK